MSHMHTHGGHATQAKRRNEQWIGCATCGAMRGRLAHSYADELPPSRPTIERDTPGEALRAFLTFGLLIVSLYILVIAAGLSKLPEVVRS